MFMKTKNLFRVLTGLLLACLIIISLGIQASIAQETKTQDMKALNAYKKLAVKPSLTDARITKYDLPHLVYYDPKVKNNKVLLWLFGTSGTTDDFPVKFLKTALDQGYRV